MVPQRMCAVCRERREKDELLRIAKSKNGKIDIDRDGKMQGRGMYICKNGECLINASKRRVIERAFSCNTCLDVYEAIKEYKEGL